MDPVACIETGTGESDEIPLADAAETVVMMTTTGGRNGAAAIILDTGRRRTYVCTNAGAMDMERKRKSQGRSRE